LLPSQLIAIDRSRLAGICLAAGGVTSHVALLAISMQLPMLVAAGAQLTSIEDGCELLLDADHGELVVAPTPAAASQFDRRVEAEQQLRAEQAPAARQPCSTLDGVPLLVCANLASAAEAHEAVAAGAEGCGLLRTEFLFSDRASAPGEDEQLAVFRDIAVALGERPLVIRLLDAGADKPLACLGQAPEENPALGIRGIRLLLARPPLLQVQLRALLRLAAQHPLKVLIPMVTSVQEVDAVRQVLAPLQAEAGNARFELGAMIETPAAALIADQLAARVDFLSIGTNDLAQYTLCMDRGEPALAAQLDALHPAVLRLVRMTTQAAARAGIPVTVCGGAAGEALAAPLLVGRGVRSLPMPAVLIAGQKARLRKLALGDCEALAAKALDLSSAAAVRALVRDFLDA
jgi:phosphoenolpyruvate-protein phosphotransferase